MAAGETTHSGNSSTAVTPRCRIPRAFMAASLRSMMRVGLNGPRSLMRTTTSCPVTTLRTRTRVPMGSVRWAAVKPWRSKRSPLAVRRPWKRPPYHEAKPRSSTGAHAPAKGRAGGGSVSAGVTAAAVPDNAKAGVKGSAAGTAGTSTGVGTTAAGAGWAGGTGSARGSTDAGEGGGARGNRDPPPWAQADRSRHSAKACSSSTDRQERPTPPACHAAPAAGTHRRSTAQAPCSRRTISSVGALWFMV